MWAAEWSSFYIQISSEWTNLVSFKNTRQQVPMSFVTLSPRRACRHALYVGRNPTRRLEGNLRRGKHQGGYNERRLQHAVMGLGVDAASAYPRCRYLGVGVGRGVGAGVTVGSRSQWCNVGLGVAVG